MWSPTRPTMPATSASSVEPGSREPARRLDLDEAGEAADDPLVSPMQSASAAASTVSARATAGFAIAKSTPGVDRRRDLRRPLAPRAAQASSTAVSSPASASGNSPASRPAGALPRSLVFPVCPRHVARPSAFPN